MHLKHPLEGFSRRQFLHTAAAGATLATLPTLSVAGDRDAGERGKNDPYGGFTVGVQSYTFRAFKLDRVLATVQDLGLHFIELYNGHLPTNASEQQIQTVRALCHKHRITPIAFGVERFTKDHDANRRLFEFARNLGVRYLSADPDPDSFDSLDRLVAEFAIGIAIHPHGPSGKQLHRWYSAEIIMGP